MATMKETEAERRGGKENETGIRMCVHRGQRHTRTVNTLYHTHVLIQKCKWHQSGNSQCSGITQWHLMMLGADGGFSMNMPLKEIEKGIYENTPCSSRTKDSFIPNSSQPFCCTVVGSLQQVFVIKIENFQIAKRRMT